MGFGALERRLAATSAALLDREKRPELRITWAIRNRAAAREGNALPRNATQRAWRSRLARDSCGAAGMVGGELEKEKMPVSTSETPPFGLWGVIEVLSSHTEEPLRFQSDECHFDSNPSPRQSLFTDAGQRHRYGDL